MSATETTKAAHTDSAVADQLDRAKQQLQVGDHAGALATARAVVVAQRDNVDALYIAAVAARFAHDFPAAHDLHLKLREVAPEFGRGWQEAGHLARDEGRAEDAVRLYARAVQLNPALAASWAAQAQLLEVLGRRAEGHAARQQAERLAHLPRELVAVTNMIHEGRILKAEKLCRQFLQVNPRHVEGMRLLADIGSRLGVHEDAEFLLENAVAFEPDNIQLRLDYIQVLRKRQKFADALEQARALYERDTANPLFQSHLAIESLQTGDYDRALALFEQVLKALPEDPATHTSRGHALKTLGRQDEAIASYRRAIAARPEQGDAFYALANLKTYRFADEDIAVMQAQIARGDLGLMDRVHLEFALGKAFEDAQDFAQSFRHYDAGNTLKRQQTRYDADQMHAELATQKAVCTRELFAAHENGGYEAPDPIFILGLPRAGSTLLEQILASHSQVDGTLELPNILALAHRLRGDKAGQSNYPAVLAEVSDEQFRDFGRQYIEDTRIHRQGAPFFIDKMPNNFRHIGLIHLILPNAKIIDARRDPMDCCFSCYKQLFAEGQEFTYGLEQIGRYYADYVDLMAHWDAVLPGRVLRVQHEDVLEDLEGQVRRMLDFCRLPFEQACVDFHRTERAVRTASSEQVRQPISRAGQDAWRPYAEWLEPLTKALSSVGPK
ncbi:MAG: sulfotransferase [Sphingomonadaceae bacterium]